MNGQARFLRGKNYSFSTGSGNVAYAGRGLENNGSSWSSENSLSQTVNILQPTDSYDNLLPVNGAEIRQFRQSEKLKYKKPAPVDWSSRLDRLVSGWEKLKQSNFNTDDMTVNWANMINPPEDDRRSWEPSSQLRTYDDPEGGGNDFAPGVFVRSSQDPHLAEYSDDEAAVYTKLPAEPIYPKTYEDLMALRLANNETLPVTTKYNNVGNQNAYKPSKKKSTPGMDLTFGEKRNRSQPIVKQINVNVDVAKNKAAAVKKSTRDVLDKSIKAKLGAKQNPPRLEKSSSVAKPKFPPTLSNSRTIKKINK